VVGGTLSGIAREVIPGSNKVSHITINDDDGQADAEGSQSHRSSVRPRFGFRCNSDSGTERSGRSDLYRKLSLVRA